MVSPLFLAGLAALLSGCAVLETKSDPSRFYVLESPASAPTSASDAKPWPFALAVARVSLPDYLDRPQVVTRTDANRVTFSEFHRWPESLDRGVTRVFSDTLSGYLRAARVAREPSLDVYRDGVLIQVDALRFDGELGGEVLLRARWRAIAIHSGEVLTSGEHTVSAPTSGGTYDAYAVAMTEALDRFSAEVAVRLRHTVTASVTGLPVPVSAKAQG